MTAGHFVERGGGELRDLGIIQMRVLVDAHASNGAFAVLEFRGAEGPWTVPHAHHETEESFYVLEGEFDFVCGGEDITAAPGDFLLVPRGAAHMITARRGGGALLAVNAPAGLEDMFRELSQLPADSLRDPVARREVARRFDSVPI